MKLVTFRVNTPVGPVNRLGALIDGHQDGRVVDLNTAYADHLARETDEPKPQGLANLYTPPDMIGYLQGGQKSRAAAEVEAIYSERPPCLPSVPAGPNCARHQFGPAAP